MKTLVSHEVTIETAQDNTKTLRMSGKWEETTAEGTVGGSVAKSETNYDGETTADALSAHAETELKAIIGQTE